MIQECYAIYLDKGKVMPDMEKVRLDLIAALGDLGEVNLKDLSNKELYLRANKDQYSFKLQKSCILFVKAELGDIFSRIKEQDQKETYATISSKFGGISESEISSCIKFKKLCEKFPQLLYSTKSWHWIRPKIPHKLLDGQIETFNKIPK